MQSYHGITTEAAASARAVADLADLLDTAGLSTMPIRTDGSKAPALLERAHRTPDVTDGEDEK